MMLLLCVVLPTLVASSTATTANDTSALLFSLANPVAQLGFEDDAAGLSLPDAEKIMAQLTDAQQDEIVQNTIADLTRIYGSGQPPSAREEYENTRKTPA